MTKSSKIKKKTILITGIRGKLGKILAERLHRDYNIIGIDRRPGEPIFDDIEIFRIDIRRHKVEDVFRNNNIEAVLHLGIKHDLRIADEERHSFNIAGTTNLLHYCKRYKVKKFVLLSSSSVYGARPDNDVFLNEDVPLMGSERFLKLGDQVEVDMLVQSMFWKCPKMETVILRPVNIVGPTMQNALTNYLRLKKIPVLMGFDPMIQLVHETDIVSAICLAMKPKVNGIYNIAGPGDLPLSRIIKELGAKSYSIPAPIARTAISVLWKTHLTSFPVEELDYIQYVCMVDDSRARNDMGYKPRFPLDATIMSLKLHF